MPRSVRQLRKAMGVSQALLAEILGVTQPAVAAWEAQRRSPTGPAAEALDRIAGALEGPTKVYGKFRHRSIELPSERWTAVVPPTLVVAKLPLRLDWSPRQGARDMRTAAGRASLYAQVLDEGRPEDIRIWIDPDALVELWPDVPVARHMQEPVAAMVESLR
ncbi:MAG TPA: helix-turn-helix transcriptional regulator [Acidimicrobiales bacterium]